MAVITKKKDPNQHGKAIVSLTIERLEAKIKDERKMKNLYERKKK